jgi:hypothetical protein
MRDIRRFYINGKNPYKSATPLIDTHHPDIQATAEYICRKSSHSDERIEKILDFVQHDISFAFTAKSFSWSSSKVLYHKKGDLLQRLMLACALLRAADIGCRMHFFEFVHPLYQQLDVPSGSLALSGSLEVYDEGTWVKTDRFLLPENLSAHLLKRALSVRPYNGQADEIWLPQDQKHRSFGILNDAQDLQKMLSAERLEALKYSWFQRRKLNQQYAKLVQQLNPKMA